MSGPEAAARAPLCGPGHGLSGRQGLAPGCCWLRAHEGAGLLVHGAMALPGQLLGLRCPSNWYGWAGGHG